MVTHKLLILLAVVAYCSADPLTPLIAWSNGRVLPSSQPTTVHELLNSANLDTVKVAVVFKAPRLTFDDLAKFSGAYGVKNAPLSSVQTEVQSSSSHLWSGLSGQPASFLISSLAFTMDTTARYVKVGDELSLDKDGRAVFVVSLPNGEDEVGFGRQGEIIAQIMSTLKTSIPDTTFLVFYTSDSGSSSFEDDIVSDEEDYYDDEFLTNGGTILKVHHDRQVRQSGGDNDDKKNDDMCVEISTLQDGTLFTCAALCITNTSGIERVNVTNENHRRKDVKDMKELLTDFMFVGGDCDVNNTNYSSPYIRAQATLNNTDETVQLTFVFLRCIGKDCPLQETFNITEHENTKPIDVPRKTILRQGYWRLDLHIQELPGEEQRFLRSPEGTRIFTQFEIPFNVSYACGRNKLNHFELPKTPEDDDESFIQYRFPGIQAEINLHRSTSGNNPFFFSSAYNCQGYFSNMSWMGIVAVLITIFFLYVATVFSFSIETIDRFDDPRGPTITVENLH